MLTILTNNQIWQERSLNARKQLRETLSKARETAKMTQQNLADAIGVGVRTIGDAESGDGNPEFDALVRIVRFLHIPVMPSSIRNRCGVKAMRKTSLFWRTDSFKPGSPPVMNRKSCC